MRMNATSMRANFVATAKPKKMVRKMSVTPTRSARLALRKKFRASHSRRFVATVVAMIASFISFSCTDFVAIATAQALLKLHGAYTDETF